MENNNKTPDLTEVYEGDDEFDYPDLLESQDEEQETVRMSQKEKRRFQNFRLLYLIISAVIALNVILVLLITVNYLPPFGSELNPAVNEVSIRYIERGTEETSSLNIVTAILFSYRSFDTLGEAFVLFAAAMAVTLLMRDFESS